MKVTTLTVDCGGTGIKASVLDKGGKVLIDFPYLKTPYPLSPSKLISIIDDFVKEVNAEFKCETDSEDFKNAEFELPLKKTEEIFNCCYPFLFSLLCKIFLN